MPVTRSVKVRDSRDAYYDKKTGVYYNHNFWNIENVIRGDSERSNDTSDSEFLDLMSPPFNPTGSLILPRVLQNDSSAKSRKEPKVFVSNTAPRPVYHHEDDKETPQFTLRLAQKDIHPNPLSKMKVRPQSAAPSNIQSTNIDDTKTSHNHFTDKDIPIPRRVSSPYPIRITQTAIVPDDISSDASRQIIASYMQCTLPTRSRLAVTPSNFDCHCVTENKPKAWVKSEVKQSEVVTNLSKIYQLSKEKAIETDREVEKTKRSKQTERKKIPPRTQNLYLHNSTALRRGSNWRKKECPGKKKSLGPPKVYKPVLVRPPGHILHKKVVKAPTPFANTEDINVLRRNSTNHIINELKHEMKLDLVLPSAYNEEISIQSLSITNLDRQEWSDSEGNTPARTPPRKLNN